MAALKFIASQARSIHQYKNLKIKVLKCCADIFFNRQCTIFLLYLNIVLSWPEDGRLTTETCSQI